MARELQVVLHSHADMPIGTDQDGSDEAQREITDEDQSTPRSFQIKYSRIFDDRLKCRMS